MNCGAFDKEVDRLEQESGEGRITQVEYRAELRDLRDCLESEASEAAMDAYNDVMGCY